MSKQLTMGREKIAFGRPVLRRVTAGQAEAISRAGSAPWARMWAVSLEHRERRVRGHLAAMVAGRRVKGKATGTQTGDEASGRVRLCALPLPMALTLSLLIVCAAGAGQNVWTTSGPEEGSVRSLAIDPVNPQTLYAGGGILHKSEDGGESWARILDSRSLITAVAIDPQNSQTLYVGTRDRIHKSEDGGENWIVINFDGILALVLSPRNSQTLYAGVSGSSRRGNGVYKTEDGGESWTAINTGLPASLFTLDIPAVQVLLVDPQDSQTLYFGTEQVMHKSEDGGESWTALSTGLPDFFSILALAIDLQNPQTFYAGTFAGLYRSENGGASWTATGFTESTDDDSHIWVHSLVIDPEEPRRLYAGTSEGVYMSEDRGETWLAINTSLANTNVQVLVLDLQTPQTLYSGTGAGVFSLTFPSSTAVLEDYTAAPPQSFTLSQNYPNPFNSGTVIRFALPTATPIELVLYNLAGQKVVTLIKGVRETGTYTVRWDGKDGQGRELASGVYLYRIKAGTQVQTRKLSLLQ